LQNSNALLKRVVEVTTASKRMDFGCISAQAVVEGFRVANHLIHMIQIFFK